MSGKGKDKQRAKASEKKNATRDMPSQRPWNARKGAKGKRKEKKEEKKDLKRV
jgi:hypothetical protein